MAQIKALPEFTAWLDGVSDPLIRATLAARIKRLERGLLVDGTNPSVRHQTRQGIGRENRIEADRK